MIIPISEDRRIQITKNEYQVQRTSVCQQDTLMKKKGDIAWVPYQFCSTMGGAMRILHQEGLASSDAETIEDCIKSANRILDKLSTAITPNFEVKEIA